MSEIFYPIANRLLKGLKNEQGMTMDEGRWMKDEGWKRFALSIYLK
ncbi:MAG: hypothetical protein WCB15_12465 [Desulfobacterales bacterium]|jgi:hypothetical protein